jgi:hypothetical protein
MSKLPSLTIQRGAGGARPLPPVVRPRLEQTEPADRPIQPVANLEALSQSDNLEHWGAIPVRLERMRLAARSRDEGHRSQMYNEAGDVARIAAILENNLQSWMEFCSMRNWEGFGPREIPRETRSAQALYFVYRQVYGPGAEARKQAHHLAKCVRYLLDQGITPDAIPDQLANRGGFAGVAQQRSGKKEDSGQTQPCNTRFSLVCIDPAHADQLDKLEGSFGATLNVVRRPGSKPRLALLSLSQTGPECPKPTQDAKTSGTPA